MIRVRRSNDRGGADHGWLITRHTFSFADYHDPEHVAWRSLRVINEDRIRAGHGFPPHPHRDMEILTWVLSGALRHQDSLGNGSTIRPGVIQRMSAGTGVVHGEENPLEDEETHLYQIWILPDRRGHEPTWEELVTDPSERRGRFGVLASREGESGGVAIHQDASLLAADLAPGARAAHALADGRYGWLQVCRGGVRCGGLDLGAGDGAAIADQRSVEVEGTGEEESQVLLFDLA